jgi:ribosomal protein L21E
MSKKFKVGDKIMTKSEGVWQDTQESLNNRVGTIVNTDDYPYNIHVKVESFKGKPVIGFSEFELTKN